MLKWSYIYPINVLYYAGLGEGYRGTCCLLKGRAKLLPSYPSHFPLLCAFWHSQLPVYYYNIRSYGGVSMQQIRCWLFYALSAISLHPEVIRGRRTPWIVHARPDDQTPHYFNHSFSKYITRIITESQEIEIFITVLLHNHNAIFETRRESFALKPPSLETSNFATPKYYSPGYINVNHIR